MSKTVSAIVLLAALGASPGFAQDLGTADGATVVTAITPPQLIAVLGATGVTATQAIGGDGDPIVEGEASNGDHWEILMYRCTGAKAKSCTVLQFRATYTVDVGDMLKSMNDYNNAWVFGRARLNENGDAVIEYTEDLEGGITLDNLRGTLAQWDTVVQDFADHLAK
jgi:hypothetical protein